MSTVVRRIKEIKQPYGGYINFKLFKIHKYEDSNQIIAVQTPLPILQGLAVDYLTRYLSGTPKNEAFRISLSGATIMNEEEKAIKLLNTIQNLDNESIYNACQLVGYDVAFRVGPMAYKPVDYINASDVIIQNIKILVERSLKFFKQNGPIVSTGFTFEGAYTKLVHAGDGDFLTENTLWDLKVSKFEPESKDTLQIIMYYILGKHSVHKNKFDKIKKIGIYNPLLNKMYELEISNISNEILEKISKDVIGYNV